MFLGKKLDLEMLNFRLLDSIFQWTLLFAMDHIRILSIGLELACSGG